MEPNASPVRLIPMDLNEFIIRHDGVLSARQARLHLSTSAIGRRLSSGKWTAVTPGVYLVAGRHRSARAQARIAALSVGDHAVLGGAAAVWWLGAPTSRAPRRHTPQNRHRPPPARGRLTVRSDPETETTCTLTRRPHMSVARDTVRTHNMLCTRT